MTVEEDVRRIKRRSMAQCLCFTVALAFLSLCFVVSMISMEYKVDTMQHKYDEKINKIERNHATFSSDLNENMKQINITVDSTVEKMEGAVNEVHENVSSQNSLMAYQFAGTFAILGSLISLWHMASHVQNMNAPEVQRKIIAIMWMIPIYSVTSFLGLVFVQAEAFLSLFKDIYEAYVIYTFLSFLISIIGRGDREAVIDLLSKYSDHLKAPIYIPFLQSKPVFQNGREKAEAVLDQNQFFTMQFVFFKPLTSIAMIIADEFHESRWDPTYPQLYINIVTNISIFVAFTGLLRFYHVVKEDLYWCNPFSKFMSIKGVVFMTFWQKMVISFAAHAILQNREDVNASENATEWSKRAQSFLICLEMFFFSIVHAQVFPTEEWEPGYREKVKRRMKAKFGDSLALRDFVADVKTVMKSRRVKSKKNIRKGEMPLSHSNLDEDLSTSLVRIDVDVNSAFEIGEHSEHPEEDGWDRIEHFMDKIGVEDDSDGEDSEESRRVV